MMWRHLQHELGVLDTCLTVFADRYGSWGILDLWRSDDVFTASEEAFLTRSTP
jgi:hypothetical protein